MKSLPVSVSGVRWNINPSEAAHSNLYLWCDAAKVFTTEVGYVEGASDARLIYYDIGHGGLRVDLDPRDVREQLRTPKGQQLLAAVSTNFCRMAYALASNPKACCARHWTHWKLKLEGATAAFSQWFQKVLLTLDRYSSSEFIYSLTERVEAAWSEGVTMEDLRSELVIEEAERGRRLYILDVEAILESMYAALDVHELRKGAF